MIDPPPRQPGIRDVLTNANFVKLWIGLFVSFLGDRVGQMGLVAIAALGATAAAGGDSATMITFWAVLPYVVLGPVAGAIVDRVDRRHLMMATDIFRGLILLAVPYLFTHQSHDFGVYAVAFLVGCATCLFQPARSAFLPEIVPADHLLRANSITSTMGTLTVLVGTVVGGLLISSLSAEGAVSEGVAKLLGPVRLPVGLSLTFLVDALTYFFSFGMLWWITMPPVEAVVVNIRKRELQGEGSFLKNVGHGFSYLAQHRVAGVCIGLTMLFFFVGGALFTVVNRIAFTRLAGIDPGAEAGPDSTRYLGYALGCIGIGMFAGGVATGRLAMNLPLRAVIAAMYFASAVVLFLLAGISAPSATYAALIVAGAAAGGIVVLLDTAIQRAVPDEMRGRVFALNNLALNCALLLSLAGCTHMLHRGMLNESGVLMTAALWAFIGVAVAWLGFPPRLSVQALRDHTG